MVVADAQTLTEAFVFMEAMAQDRPGPGVLVFTATLQLLYMNQSARELTGRLHQACTGRPMQGMLPQDVVDFCEDLVRLLRANHVAKDRDQLQRTRVTGGARCPMLLRGFAIPHGRSLQTAKLIIMMEALHPQSDVTDMRLQERHHLTDREQTVLIYLIQGLTSKEIGNWMDVSEHTIKEHLKHLMKKTHTTTRTGLMAKIVFAAAVPPSPGLPHALHMASAETGRKAS